MRQYHRRGINIREFDLDVLFHARREGLKEGDQEVFSWQRRVTHGCDEAMDIRRLFNVFLRCMLQRGWSKNRERGASRGSYQRFFLRIIKPRLLVSLYLPTISSRNQAQSQHKS